MWIGYPLCAKFLNHRWTPYPCGQLYIALTFSLLLASANSQPNSRIAVIWGVKELISRHREEITHCAVLFAEHFYTTQSLKLSDNDLWNPMFSKLGESRLKSHNHGLRHPFDLLSLVRFLARNNFSYTWFFTPPPSGLLRVNSLRRNGGYMRQ